MTNGISSINQNINTLDVYIGSQKKVASISIPVGSETEISLTYEPSWITEGFAISPHLPLTGDVDHKAVRSSYRTYCQKVKVLKNLPATRPFLKTTFLV